MPNPAIAIAGSALIGGITSDRASGRAADASAQANAATVAETRRQFDLVRGDTAPARALGNSAIGIINRLYGYGGTGGDPLSYEAWAKQQAAPQGIGRRPPGFEDLGLGGGRGGFRGQLGPRGATPRGPVDTSRGAYNTYVADFQKKNPGPDMGAFFESPDYQFNLAEGQKAIDRASAAGGRYNSGATLKAGGRYASNLASGEFGSFFNRLMAQAGLAQTAVGTSANAGANTAGIIANANANDANMRGNAYLAGAAGVNNAAQGAIGNALLLKYLS